MKNQIVLLKNLKKVNKKKQDKINKIKLHLLLKINPYRSPPFFGTWENPIGMGV